MQAPSIVIHGPQGCGKTHRAQALAEHFGVEQIIEGWDGRSPVPQSGALVLTNAGRAELLRLNGLRVMSFAEAKAQISAPAFA